MQETKVRLQQLTRAFLTAVFAALGIAGSAMSVLVIGAMIHGAARIALGHLSMPSGRVVVAMTLAGALYYLSGVLMVAFNPGDRGNYLMLVERLGFLCAAPLLAPLAASPRELVRDAIELGCALGAAAIAVWTVYAVSVGMPRLEGGSGNAGPFATGCALIFAVCLLAALRASRPARALIFGAAALAGAAGLLASGMRSLYPMLALAPAIAAIVHPRMRGHLSNWRVVALIVAIMAIAVFALADLVAPRIDALVDDFRAGGLAPAADTSLGQRIAVWHCALGVIGDAPFLGMGRQDAVSFIRACTLTIVDHDLKFTHYHNAAINALMFGGIVELVAVIALLVAPWLAIEDARGDEMARYGIVLLAVLTVIYLINGSINLMFGHDIHDLLFMIVAVLSVHLIAGGAEEGETHGQAAI